MIKNRISSQMTPRTNRLGAVVAVAVALATPAAAQTLNRVAAHDNWSVFVQETGGSKYCYAATTPVDTRASRGGQALDQITRDPAFLMVSTFPERDAVNEVSVRVGFPIDANQAAKLAVGSKSFGMFSDGEDAWSEKPADDPEIVAAFKAGATAEVTTISTRGTTVIDEFSLVGFTAALNDVAKRCQ